MSKLQDSVLAMELYERSKYDNKMIVGSEIRAALGEQNRIIESLRDENKKLAREVAEMNDEDKMAILRRISNGQLELIIEDLHMKIKDLRAEVEVLERDSYMLSCLEAEGVDSWHGWDLAGEQYSAKYPYPLTDDGE